jgi:hypothetical protein
MANLLSSAFKAYLAASWLTDNIKVVLLSSAYVYSSAHANLSDIAAGIVATSGNLASKTNTGGLLDAANLTFGALTGAQVTQLWIYHDTGVAGTSTLEIYINVGVNLPFTPDGTDRTLEWPSPGIAQL